MIRRGFNNFSCDYICSSCGDVIISFDVDGAKERKYSSKLMYCPVCVTETDHLRLGDKDVIKAQLESRSELRGMDNKIYNLLCLNEVRKEKRLIKK